MLAYKNLWRNPTRTYLLAGTIGLISCLIALLQAQLAGFQHDIHTQIILQSVGEAQIVSADSSKLTFEWTENLQKSLPDAVPILQGQAWARQDSTQIALQYISTRVFLQKKVQGLVISPALAAVLQARTGDSLRLCRSPSDAGRFFRISEVRRLPLPQSDNLILLPLSVAQAWQGAPAQISRLQLAHTPQASLPKHLKTRLWREVLPDLVQLLAVLRATFTLIFVILYVLLGAGVCLVVLQNWRERRQELARLRILGMTRGQVWQMLVLESAYLLFLGYGLGMVLALPALAYLTRAPLLLPPDLVGGLQDMGLPARLAFAWTFDAFLVPLWGALCLWLVLVLLARGRRD